MASKENSNVPSVQVHSDTTNTTWLSKLPNEVLLIICTYMTTPSFLVLTSTCRALFDLPKSSRDLLLHHLNSVPGITLGLEDKAVSTEQLWLLLRQRASSHLYGAHFYADCSSYTFPSAQYQLDPSASCLGHSYGDVNISLACHGSLEIRQLNSLCSPLHKLPSPYRDGLGHVVQVVHHGNFISVLYAWQALNPQEESEGEYLSSSPTVPPISSAAHPTRIPDPDPASPSYHESRERSQPPPSSRDPEPHYHLVHYDSQGFEPPTFFTIHPPRPLEPVSMGKPNRPHYKPSRLHPIHISVYNRLRCAVTWRESRLGRIRTTVILVYFADKLPPLFEQGSYASVKVYPPRPPPPPPKSSIGINVSGLLAPDTHEESRRIWQKDMVYFARYRPMATEFWHHGHKLAIYSSAHHLPFATTPVDLVHLNDQSNAQLGRFQSLFPHLGLYFQLGRPFYGKHLFSPYYRDGKFDTNCIQVYLRLAILLHPFVDKLSGLQEPKAMCVYLTRSALRQYQCSHYIDLDAPNDFASILPTGGHLMSQYAVARLWGWEPPSYNPTTMSALDTVAISPAGTRIAISYWNKVVVWALEPDVLCEGWEDYSSTNSESGSHVASNNDSDDNNHNDQDEAANTNPDSDSNSDSAADPGGHAQHDQVHNDFVPLDHIKPKSGDSPAVGAADFYNMARDKKLGEIAEIRPIVLYLPNGQVARKMRWRSMSPEENDENSDEEGLENDSGDSWGDSDSDSSSCFGLTAAPPSPPPAAPSAPEEHYPTGRLSRWARGQRGRSPSSSNGWYNPTIASNSQSNSKEDDEVRHRVRHGVSKPSETWKMNKTMDQVTEEEDAEAEDEGEESGETTKICQKKKRKETISDEERQEHSADDDVDSGNNHDEEIGVAAELLRRRQRHIKGKLPVRDPPGPYLIRSQVGNSNDITSSRDDGHETRQSSQQAHPPSQAPGPDSSGDHSPSLDNIQSKRKKEKKRVRRQTEDELVILTDRGVQVWNMGVWATGRREEVELIFE